MLKKLFSIKSICIFLVVLWIIFYPLQFVFAQIKVLEYMKKQGIHLTNIKSESFTTGILTDDYYITVKLKDDPNFEYEYLYAPENLFSSKDCYFRLIVFNYKTNSSYSSGDTNIPKYKPLS